MPEKQQQGYKLLRVQLKPGFFDNEVTVIATDTDGRQIESIVPAENVRVESAPTGVLIGEGLLRVRVVGSAGDEYIIDLPKPSFSSEPRFTVSGKELVSF